MTDEVNQSPSLPMEGSPEESPMIAIHPSVEEKTNIMTLEELNALRDTYSFPSGVQVRLPDEGEIITSTRPSEVAFYEAASPAGLRFPLHPTIRLILQFYNICPAQLVPNAWRSIACSMALWRVYKYSISLSEFRNLFSLNSNPKPDQGWLYFKARNKRVLLGGYPSNVKGWKSKFFFVSGDEWEIPEGTPREGVPRVPRTWGIPDKHCNNPPRLYSDKPKVFEEIFRSVEQSGRFSVPVLLDSKSYRRVFVSPGSRASRTAGDNLPSREAPSSSSDNRTEEVVTSYPRPDPFEMDGGKVLDPILDRFLNAPSSNPSSESCSNSSLPVELESDAMSKRVSFKKIGEKLEKMAGVSSGTPVPAKGVVIGEKREGESTTSSPSKKGKTNDGSKGKRGRDLSSPRYRFEPPFYLGQPVCGREVAAGVIPLADKEKVDKLTLDQTATKLFHVIGQALVLSSSLAVRSREVGEQASLQEGSRDRVLLVNELREALDKANESAVEEFKSSSEFMVAVEDSASKYFGEGFDFCKVQLRQHHPDLAIDLEGTVVDQDLLAEQDEAAEEREKRKFGRE
ncbi:hypothetical protein Acr_28g0004670 [Actinidia rufa]|uniref:Transposase (putative) gypsy type domain-containing protein n=1 Tax=Actinidia rufa TaxID=165716 RepID=A0A7J0H9G9_9ERIC|nr:hypothetical protein Acr_28g0004670 [Actinidia rufa]